MPHTQIFSVEKVTEGWLHLDKQTLFYFPHNINYKMDCCFSKTQNCIEKDRAMQARSEMFLTLLLEGIPSCKEWPPQLRRGRYCAAGRPLLPGPAFYRPPLLTASTALHTGPDLTNQTQHRFKGKVQQHVKDPCNQTQRGSFNLVRKKRTTKVG